MKKIVVLATATAAVIVAAGCSTLGKQAFADPIVTLKDVKVTNVGVVGGGLDVVLNVYNPNGYRLDATRLNYRIQVDSTPLANGTLDNRFTVQDKDSTRVTIPVSFSWSGLGAAGRSIFNTGALNYRVTGDITVGSVVGNFTIPFSQTGRYSTLGR
jgi:LEA14-like dessication related protein